MGEAFARRFIVDKIAASDTLRLNGGAGRGRPDRQFTGRCNVKVPVEITINGKSYSGEVEARQLLVHFIREEVGLTGTKVGCDTSQCGSCTVKLDGAATKACTVLTVQASGSEVTTIEGLADGSDLHPLQEAFWNKHGLQCGFCTPGMIIAADELLRKNPSPSRSEIRHGLEGNICRCTGYQNIVLAVEEAARSMGGA